MRKLTGLYMKTEAQKGHIAAYAMMIHGESKKKIMEKLGLPGSVFTDLEKWGYLGNVETSFEKDFDEVWKYYPKKIGKTAAYKAYVARRRAGVSKDNLLKATKGYVDATVGTDKQFIKNGSTFFGPNDHWIDYINTDEEKSDPGKKNPEYYCKKCQKIFEIDPVLKQFSRCPVCGRTIEEMME